MADISTRDKVIAVIRHRGLSAGNCLEARLDTDFGRVLILNMGYSMTTVGMEASHVSVMQEDWDRMRTPVYFSYNDRRDTVYHSGAWEQVIDELYSDIRHHEEAFYG